MRYLGLDVHAKATVWCLLAQDAEVLGRGKVSSTEPELTALVDGLRESDELLAGQEIGTQSYFVHDVLTAAGVKLLSFNAQQLRMLASSRKKTDKRDAYWIAKALQTEMMPHPVYIPSGQVRQLRQLLSQRETLKRDQKRWLVRARSSVRAAGHQSPPGARTPGALRVALLAKADGLDQQLDEALARCDRMHDALSHELVQVAATIRREAHDIEAIKRLQTIPAVGEWTALTIHAWVGDVSRFPNARRLAAYAGLVPSVWRSGESERCGGITKLGSPALRSILTQAGHVLLWRCSSAEAAPLKALATRVLTARTRRKIAVVAAARHILRIAYYVLRDGTSYDPARLAAVQPAVE
jgi:transposase